MPRWRRLCIDVDEQLHVLGASIEWYTDQDVAADEILVLAQTDWANLSVAQALIVLCAIEWRQPTLPFGGRPSQFERG